MNVSVDDKFARFGSKSYAINKINSVDVRVRRPHGEGAIWACGLVALIAAISFLGSLLAGRAEWWHLILATIFGGLAYVAWRKSKIREYQLFLMTSSSEAQAFVTQDSAEIHRLREEIERAMAAS